MLTLFPSWNSVPSGFPADGRTTLLNVSCVPEGHSALGNCTPAIACFHLDETHIVFACYSLWRVSRAFHPFTRRTRKHNPGAIWQLALMITMEEKLREFVLIASTCLSIGHRITLWGRSSLKKVKKWGEKICGRWERELNSRSDRPAKTGDWNSLATDYIFNTSGRSPQTMVTQKVSVLHKPQFPAVNFKILSQTWARSTQNMPTGHSTWKAPLRAECQGEKDKLRGKGMRDHFNPQALKLGQLLLLYQKSLASSYSKNDRLVHVLQSCHEWAHLSTWKNS